VTTVIDAATELVNSAFTVHRGMRCRRERPPDLRVTELGRSRERALVHVSAVPLLLTVVTAVFAPTLGPSVETNARTSVLAGTGIVVNVLTNVILGALGCASPC